MKEIRTYLPFNYPVDPAKIVIIPDMDLSYALASTLVEWSPAKQLTSGLAATWKISAENAYSFTLRPNAKWSDGSPITSEEIKRSFERDLKKYPEDMRSLANMLERIECPNQTTITFYLKMPAAQSTFLQKLTEPNYGILKVQPNGEINLSVSTGAFYLSSGSHEELILKRNPNWHNFSDGVAEEVIIRRPSLTMDSQSVLLNDRWPNFIETSSLLSRDLSHSYESSGYQVWRRPIDKVFLFELGKRMRNSQGYALLQFLNAHLDRSTLTEGLSGFTVAHQLFPKGYQLYDLNYQQPKDGEAGESFKKKLDILMSPARVPPHLKHNIEIALKKLGIEANFISLPLQEAFQRREVGNFDLYAGTYGIADPDPEGIMSFYFEGTTPVVPSGTINCVKLLDAARRMTDPVQRVAAMRRIVAEAVRDGYVLPLMHLSTVGIGRDGLDFSKVPLSDESVTWSKIRFK